MPPDVHPVVLASDAPASKLDKALPELNHRSCAIILFTIGLFGTGCEIAASTIVVPRLALFASVLVLGTIYLVRVARRSHRRYG